MIWGRILVHYIITLTEELIIGNRDYPKKHDLKVARPKSKRQRFGALLGRAFHMGLSLSKGMLFDSGERRHR